MAMPTEDRIAILLLSLLLYAASTAAASLAISAVAGARPDPFRLDSLRHRRLNPLATREEWLQGLKAPSLFN